MTDERQRDWKRGNESVQIKFKQGRDCTLRLKSKGQLSLVSPCGKKSAGF